MIGTLNLTGETLDSSTGIWTLYNGGTIRAASSPTPCRS